MSESWPHSWPSDTAAIGQLGSDTLDVRLGGIYGLEQIAGESTTLHRTVIEVLSAFVREHTITGRSGTIRRSRDRPPADPSPPSDLATTTVAPAGPDTDVQAALTVLGRLPTREGVPRADLTGAQIPDADLAEADLAEAHLSRANLTRTDLDSANLTGAWLTGANLAGAWLDGADLTDAWLDGADLTGAWLTNANLTNAHLARANLTDAQMDLVDGIRRAAMVTTRQLETALGSGGTVLPLALERPKSWPAATPSN